jgi:septum formation protein
MIVLASGSPRRAHILRQLGIEFRVVVSEADESLLPGEDGAEAAERLAQVKAVAVASSQSLPVLGADTIVLCDGHILGKPVSVEHAKAMLRLLAGRTHQVVTGLCLVSDGCVRSARDRTEVRVAPLDQAEIDWYVSTGEPMDKAGAYHIDGRGGLFIEAVAGSPSNVAGLPIRALLRLAREAGVELGPGGPGGRPE